MKLRINAKLKAALIAAITTVGFTLPLAQAEVSWNGGPKDSHGYTQVFYLNNGNTASLTDTDHDQFLITSNVDGANPATGEITSVVTKDGALMRISGGNNWGDDRILNPLTIDNVQAGGGTGTVNISTQPWNASRPAANTTVSILAVSGTVGSVENYGVLTLGASGSTINASGTLVNHEGATLTLNGSYTFDTTDATRYTLKTAGTTGWTDADHQQGFVTSKGSSYYVIKGATDGANIGSITDSTGTALTRESSGNYYFTAGDVTDTTKFYVKAATATLDHDGTGQIVVEKAGATVTVQNAKYRDTSGSKNLNIIVNDGGVLEITHSGSNGYVTGDITINGGGTFRVAGQHDAFGWGGGTTKNIILQGEVGNVATLDFQQTSGNSATFNAALKMMGYAAITGAKGFNTHDGSFYAEGLNNTIESFQIRHAATFEVKEGGELTVGTMTRGTDGNKTLTKAGKGTMTFTTKAQADGLFIDEGKVVISGGSGNSLSSLVIGEEGTLEITGGTTSVSGSSNVISHTIAVQGGTLNLAGSYAIDTLALDADSTVVYYNADGEVANSGFRSVLGSKTVYTAGEGATVNAGSASFTVNGDAVEVTGGKYMIAGEIDHTQLWVNSGDTASYDAYYAASGDTPVLTAAWVADGATLTIGTQAVGTLVFQTNGATANIAGVGSINGFSGKGTLHLTEGARVSVPDMTVGNDQGVFSTGPGMLEVENVNLNANASRIEFDSATTIGTAQLTGGAITFGGDGITHNVTNLKLSQEGNRDSTVNVEAGTTLHITGTVVSDTQPNRFAGSFSISHWAASNVVNVYGTLISEVVVSSCDGTGTINVENGGRLEMRDGLNRGNYNNNAITINVKSGATLAAGTTHNTTQTKNSDTMVVNMAGGSTFEAYYGAQDTTAVINKVLAFGEGTVTLNAGEAGKTLQLNSNIAGEGVTIAKTGEGALELNGNANVLYNAINVQAGTLALNGTFDLSHITHEQGTVKYFKDDQPGTVESDNGFAKYVGEVQLVNGLTENVTQGASATLTLDGYNVTYDAATGKAVSSDISLATYYINTGSETLSEIQQVSPTAGVSMKGGTTLVADADFSGSLTVTGDGNGKLVISKGKLVSATAPNQALELSGEGTYTLGSTLSLGNVTLGDDWTGIVRVTDYTPNNAQNIGAVVRGTNSTVELMGFKGWDNNWNGTVNYNVKLTNGSDGYAWQNGAFGGGQQTETFTGTWSGDGMFQVVGATGDRTMHYTYSGNIKDWTGEFQKDGKQVTNLTFTGSAKDVNITISHVAGAAALNVIADAEGIVFSKGVAADAFTANVATTLKGETTIGSLSGAGALTVAAGENTVTVNGISGLANTITLTSGTLSLNGTVDISNDMPVTDGGVYYIGGQDTDNGFKTVEGKLQVVDIAAGAHLIEGEGISYRLGGEEIATALDNGAILVEPTTTYGTFYVNKAGTTESIANAIRVATEAGSTLTAVVMSADTTLAANAEATYSLALAADASATVDVTAATTISSLTGPVAGKTLTVTGSNAITIQSASDFEGNVSITGATVKLGSQTALGKYNTDTAKVITIGAGGTVDTNGQIDANYNYVLAGGTLTNTGDGKNVNNSQTTGLTLTANSYIGSEGQNEMWVARRGHAPNTIELGGFTLTKNGAGLFGFKNSAITAGTLQVNAGTVKLDGSSIAAHVVLNGGALTGTLTPSADINVTAQKSVTIGSDLAFSIAEGKTVTLKTAEEQAITFSTAFAHANGKLAAAGTVNFNQGLAPNSGTVEVSGTVNVSGKSLDLSSGGNSTGKLNVTGTGVLNVNNGMWMNTTAIDIAEGGTMNIAGLHIVGEADGATIATTAGNQNYGTNNDKYVITNAAVTGTTNINLGNKLVNSTLTTGAYTMTLNNAASTYDAVYVSTGGTLVVNADIDLAGVLHSSGAITVNEEKSLTLAEGSSLYQTITNSGTVSLTGVTLGDGFSEQTEGSAYYDINGNATTEDQNHYVGSATTYVQVVDGGASSGTGIVWNEKSYDLSENTGRIIVGQGGVDYGTFYMMDGTVELSKLNADTKGVEVKGGTLVVDKSASGIDITVTNDGTITGDEAMPEDVKIASLATAKFTQDVAGAGYEFKTGDAQQGESDNVTITNFGEDAAYSAENPLMMVSAQTLEMTDVENDATVTNMVWVSEIVNETGHKLTLENADSLALESMTIGEGSTVQVLYDLDEQTTAEGMVSITESLVAGGGTLLADLTIIGNEQGTTMWALQGTAMTLGSEFTLDVTQSLINLDDATIAALDGLSVGDSMEFITAAQNTGLTYGGDGYEGMWYDGLFVRTDALQGDYRVYANEQGFGLTKVSNVPEPTTGTLSLLALMALAARRRRH